jgi:hypothetical protein
MTDIPFQVGDIAEKLAVKKGKIEVCTSVIQLTLSI